MHQAQSEDASEDKTIMLNVALAWLRLARQTEAIPPEDSSPTAPEIDTAPEVEQHELAS
jgi:hypothetical protein